MSLNIKLWETRVQCGIYPRTWAALEGEWCFMLIERGIITFVANRPANYLVSQWYQQTVFCSHPVQVSPTHIQGSKSLFDHLHVITSCVADICRLVEVLHDFGHSDWQLASLVCKTLWNFRSVNSPSLHETLHWCLQTIEWQCIYAIFRHAWSMRYVHGHLCACTCADRYMASIYVKIFGRCQLMFRLTGKGVCFYCSFPNI